jgi:ankyrin repeat protein
MVGSAMADLRSDEPLAVAAIQAIRTGDVDALQRLLDENPSLATARIGDTANCRASGGGAPRTLLHIATDWPGHFPNGAATVAALMARGADVNARFHGVHTETPLHWAASSDDVEVLDALLDHGADIEARGAVIGGGTPLSDAVAFGQWQAARRLVERGARPSLWEAAALGLMPRVEEHCAAIVAPNPDEVTNAFWCACHGGQRRSAEYLLGRGADLNWVGHDALTPVDAASRSGAVELVEWLRSQGAKSAKDL